MPSPATPLLTIGRLAARAGLARGTLLHYEALGLLRPQARSEAGYRLYGAGEVERVRWIRRYRDAGLSLAVIGTLFDNDGTPPGDAAAHLANRLLALSTEIERLREQQQLLARLLAQRRALINLGSKAEWVDLLWRAGFDDAAMQRWHAAFEAEDAAGHAAFLHALGLRAAEVATIRRRARS